MEAQKGGVSKLQQLSSLSLPQLEHMKNQLEEEVNFLTTSMAQLKVVQQKLSESKLSVASFALNSDGREILVPLSTSMYVPGKLCNSQSFICDVGTGYYLEKNQEQTKEYFQRRIDYVTANIEKLQKALMEKYKIGEAVVSVMQFKMQAAQTQKAK